MRHTFPVSFCGGVSKPKRALHGQHISERPSANHTLRACPRSLKIAALIGSSLEVETEPVYNVRAFACILYTTFQNDDNRWGFNILYKIRKRGSLESQYGSIIMRKPRILNIGWSFMVYFTEENLSQSK